MFDNRNGGYQVPSSDFDFESANARFAKDKDVESSNKSPVATGAAAADAVLLDAIPPASEEPKSFYDKSSFFDNISSEVRQRHAAGQDQQQQQPQQRASPVHDRSARGSFQGGGGAGRGRQARFEEDRKNLDTFGEVGNSTRGMGRGRGGRGRGRGRGGRGGRGGGGGGFGAGITLA